MGKFLGSFGKKAAHSGLQFACLTTCCRPEQRSELLNRKRGDNNEINPNSRALLQLANVVWGNVIFLHLSVILFTGGGVVSQHALQLVSQHALQGGSPGPHLEGKLRDLAGGGLQAHTQGVSRPTPGGVSRFTPRGLSRPTPGGGGCVSQHALRQTPHEWLLPRAVRILLECILVSTGIGENISLGQNCPS